MENKYIPSSVSLILEQSHTSRKPVSGFPHNEEANTIPEKVSTLSIIYDKCDVFGLGNYLVGLLEGFHASLLYCNDDIRINNIVKHIDPSVLLPLGIGTSTKDLKTNSASPTWWSCRHSKALRNICFKLTSSSTYDRFNHQDAIDAFYSLLWSPCTAVWEHEHTSEIIETSTTPHILPRSNFTSPIYRCIPEASRTQSWKCWLRKHRDELLLGLDAFSRCWIFKDKAQNATVAYELFVLMISSADAKSMRDMWASLFEYRMSESTP